MHPGLTDVKDYAALIATVIGAFIALLAFWKRILSGVRAAAVSVAGWVTLPSRIMRDVAVIKAQTLPNGGKSLADSIQRLELGVAAIREKQIENYQITAALAAHDDVGIWRSDPKGNCVSINQNILRRVGFSEADALGKGWVNYIAHADRERVYQEWFLACEQKRDFILKYHLIDRHGESIPVSAHSSVIRDTRGEIAGYLGLVRFE